MRFTVRLGDSSAFAQAVKDAAEEVVQGHLDTLVGYMEEEWVEAIDQAGIGTSRPGTSKADVTPIREAVSGEVESAQFPMVVHYKLTAEDARAKLDALTHGNPPHQIRGNPYLVYPDSRTGRKVRVKVVNWRPSRIISVWETVAVQRAKRRFLALFR